MCCYVSHRCRLSFQRLAAGLFAAILFSQTPVLADVEWSSVGEKTFTMHHDGGTIYVAAGAKVRLEVTEFVEKDTKTEDVVVNEETGETEVVVTEEDDPQRQWRMIVDEQTVQTGSGLAKIDFLIDAATPVGTQIVVDFEYGDTRGALDDRHDAFAA